jgi:hypothetical protein
MSVSYATLRILNEKKLNKVDSHGNNLKLQRKKSKAKHYEISGYSESIRGLVFPHVIRGEKWLN